MTNSDPRTQPFPSVPSIEPTLNRQLILDEVARGRRNEGDRLADAAENLAFLDLDGERFIPRREAEVEFDYASRIKKSLGFTHKIITKLCEHTYNPGPQRSVSGDTAADELLQQVYEQCHIDATMAEAELLATANMVAAIEIKATNDDDEPISLQLWGGEEFAVFLDPNDQRKAYAVCTIDRYDCQTRYRLWFDDVVHTFITKKADPARGETGVVAFELANSPEENTYGTIPFAWLPYSTQVKRFWTNSPGTFVREADKTMCTEASELAETIAKFNYPIGIFTNVSPEV